MNSNTLHKYRKRVLDYLKDFKQVDETQIVTHRSWGDVKANYCLDKDANKEFLKIYTKAIEKGVNNLTIVELQKKYAPILIDIDLQVPREDNMDIENLKRLYDNALINNIVKKYVNVINDYFDITRANIKIVILEKEKPKVLENNIKDGFHIIITGISANSRTRHLIRHKVVEMCNDEETFEGFTECADKIIDRSVVSSNGWLLYGSKKPECESTYEVTKIYDKNLTVLFNKKKSIIYDAESGEYVNGGLEKPDIIQLLSVQSSNYSKNKATPLSETYNDSDVSAECEKLGISSIAKSDQPIYQSSDVDEDIRKSNIYVNMLGQHRAEDFHDWLRVGLALHTIDDSLLTVWDEFSKRSKKYKKNECAKMWNTMKNKSSTGNVLTIRSLAYWAKMDDPKQYEAFISEEMRNYMKDSADEDNYNLAKCVFAKYSDRFVCSSCKNNIWWEFKNGRWIKIDDAYTLKLLLSEDFTKEYEKEIASLALKSVASGSNMLRDELANKRVKYEKIIRKLKNTNFKEILIKECKNLFYDPKFEEKLDSNIYLIGFTNGVYDLEKEEFRQGRPDDYITLSTKVDYKPWSDKNPYASKIKTFFSQVFPNSKVRDYFLTVLATCVAGETKEEKFYILTGSGSNGKSLTNDLMKYALGDYYMPCNISMVTQKRGKANEASPELIKSRGRRMGVYQEPDENDKINPGLMKELTGGDTMSIRDLYKGANDMIELKPQMKYFLTCNQLPLIPVTDDGTWRRIRKIDFSSRFIINPDPSRPNEFLIDTGLKKHIFDWAPAFASYLIHIYCKVYKNTNGPIIEPDEVKESTNQYKKENSYIDEFISDNIISVDDKTKVIRFDDIWTGFVEWYMKEYHTNKLPMKRHEFTRSLKEGRTKLGFTKSNIYEGYIFKIKSVQKDDELD